MPASTIPTCSRSASIRSSAADSAYFNWEQDGTGVDFAEVELRLFGVTVTDLTEIAPVPLPAALPMLGAGVAAFGWLARRRRRAVAPAG